MSQKKLITTADYLFTNEPVMFLGNWCLNYRNKKIWSKMNYEILKTKFFENKNNEMINQKSKKIYEKLINEFSNKLNLFHKVNWTAQSWKILIGPWLYRYISIMNYRIDLIIESKKNNKNLVIEKDNKINELSLASYDLEDFSDKILLDKYNKYIYCKIFDFIENEKKYNINNLENCRLENQETFSENFFDSLKNRILKIIESNICKNNNFIFFKIYIGDIFTTLRLYLKLKEIPFKYNIDEKRFFFKFEKDLRTNFFTNSKKFDLNENIIRYFYLRLFPSLP